MPYMTDAELHHKYVEMLKRRIGVLRSDIAVIEGKRDEAERVQAALVTERGQIAHDIEVIDELDRIMGVEP